MDETGRKVSGANEINPGTEPVSIRIDHLHDGAYFIHLSNGELRISKMFIKR